MSDRDLILDLMREGRNNFTSVRTHVMEMRERRPEHIDVEIDYEICGITWDREASMNKIFVTVHGMRPIGHFITYVDLAHQMVFELECQIPKLSETFYVSIDQDSIDRVNCKEMDMMDADYVPGTNGHKESRSVCTDLELMDKLEGILEAYRDLVSYLGSRSREGGSDCQR